MVDNLAATYRVSIRAVCKILMFNRATYYYKPHSDDQEVLKLGDLQLGCIVLV